MRLESLRARLAMVAREMPAVTSSEGATARHAEHLARIESEKPGPRRDLTVRLAVNHCRLVDEPAEYAEFLAAVGRGAGTAKLDAAKNRARMRRCQRPLRNQNQQPIRSLGSSRHSRTTRSARPNSWILKSAFPVGEGEAAYIPVAHFGRTRISREGSHRKGCG